MLRRRDQVAGYHGPARICRVLCAQGESLKIAEPTGERILDQTWRQRRRLAPATNPDQCKGLWLCLARQQDQQPRPSWTR